ncbi:epoxide hydrolase family protein [Frankia sp. Cppng1_Ct_nod]|uniref:epoxide hydrolase family protein n=1 Tax=Frankia sp. Cppng1_Ct_nod TaxID=2897162 RepID=UPI001041910D|nr:epoxide hydrolase family protein [Frankia sp. Cppng1_Ct_nod]
MSTPNNDEIIPFTVTVSDDVIEDLRDRLSRTRWPDQLPETGWDYGTDRGYLHQLCEYWRTKFDFRAFEKRLNTYPQFLTTIDALRVHFYHVRSPEPDAMPLILTHGWPGSCVEYLSAIGPLSDPVAHGGDAADAFHVVVPSLPGFAFSGHTTVRGVHGRAIAPAFAALMARLGYSRYLVQGGDIGAQISALLGEIDPEHVAAVHLNLLPLGPPPNPMNPFEGLSGEDLEVAQKTFGFLEHDTGYWRIQATRPQTVSYGLNDSPAGLAGWIVEKFRAWTDCGGDIESAFTKDELLTNITLYWITQTINSSARYYYENTGPGRMVDPPKVEVPTGYAMFPGEHYKMPLAWAKDNFNLVHSVNMAKGGHFAAMQVPELFVEEVRGFFRGYRTRP